MSDMGDTITITGNVATDPERKHTSGGVAITTFRVARTLRRYERGTGAWTDAGTNFYTVSVFRALADHAFESLRKGDRVILTGKLRVRDWDNGNRRGTAVDIDAEAIGHDLRWGTTTFVKDARATSTRTAADWSQTRDDDAWAAPGVDAADAVGATLDGTVPTDGPQPLVLAGTPSAQTTSDDAPF